MAEEEKQEEEKSEEEKLLIKLRILNVFFGSIIGLISIIAFFNLKIDIITLLLIFTFGIFNFGVANVVIGISDTKQHRMAQFGEVIIGVFATSVGLLLFFMRAKNIAITPVYGLFNDCRGPYALKYLRHTVGILYAFPITRAISSCIFFVSA